MTSDSMDHATQMRITQLLDHVHDTIAANLRNRPEHHEVDSIEAEEYERSSLDPGFQQDCERVLNLCEEEDMRNASSNILSLFVRVFRTIVTTYPRVFCNPMNAYTIQMKSDDDDDDEHEEEECLIHRVVKYLPHDIAVPVFDILIEQSLDFLTLKDGTGSVPLHRAMDNLDFNSDAVIKLIVANSDAVLQKDNKGFTCLHKAVMHENLSSEVISFMLAVNPLSVSEKTLKNELPIHLLLKSCNSMSPREVKDTVFHILLEADVDSVKVQDMDGRLPIHDALSNPQPSMDIVETLIKLYPESLTFVDEHKNTPLHLAVAINSLKCIELFLSEFQGAAMMHNADGLTPIIIALKNEYPHYNPNVIKEMLSLCPDCGAIKCSSGEKMPEGGYYGDYPLHYAVNLHPTDLKMISAIIRAFPKAIDIPFMEYKDTTPLKRAIKNSDTLMIDIMLSGGMESLISADIDDNTTPEEDENNTIEEAGLTQEQYDHYKDIFMHCSNHKGETVNKKGLKLIFSVLGEKVISIEEQSYLLAKGKLNLYEFLDFMQSKFDTSQSSSNDEIEMHKDVVKESLDQKVADAFADLRMMRPTSKLGVAIKSPTSYYVGKSKKAPRLGLGHEPRLPSAHVNGRMTALSPIVDDIIHDEESMDKDYIEFHHSKGFAEFKSIDLHDLSRHDSFNRIVRNKVRLKRKVRIGDDKKLNTIANIRKNINETFKRPSSSAHKLPSLAESHDDKNDNDVATKEGNTIDKERTSPGYKKAKAFAEEISMSSSLIPVKKSNRQKLKEEAEKRRQDKANAERAKAEQKARLLLEREEEEKEIKRLEILAEQERLEREEAKRVKEEQERAETERIIQEIKRKEEEELKKRKEEEEEKLRKIKEEQEREKKRLEREKAQKEAAEVKRLADIQAAATAKAKEKADLLAEKLRMAQREELDKAEAECKEKSAVEIHVEDREFASLSAAVDGDNENSRVSCVNSDNLDQDGDVQEDTYEFEVSEDTKEAKGEDIQDEAINERIRLRERLDNNASPTTIETKRRQAEESLMAEMKRTQDPGIVSAIEERKSKLRAEEPMLEVDAAVAALSVAEECERIARQEEEERLFAIRMEEEMKKKEIELDKKRILDEKENKIKADRAAAQKAMQMKMRDKRVAREKEAEDRKKLEAVTSLSNTVAINNAARSVDTTQKSDSSSSDGFNETDTNRHDVNSCETNVSDVSATNRGVDSLEEYRVQQETADLTKMEAATEKRHLAVESETNEVKPQEQEASDGECSDASQGSGERRRKKSIDNPYSSRNTPPKSNDKGENTKGEDVNTTVINVAAIIDDSNAASSTTSFEDAGANKTPLHNQGTQEVENISGMLTSNTSSSTPSPLKESAKGNQQVASSPLERKELKQGKRGIFFEPTKEVESMVAVLMSVSAHMEYDSVQKTISEMPLPDGWIRCKTADDKIFFWDQINAQTSNRNPNLMYLHRVAKQKFKASKKFQSAFTKIKALKNFGAVGALKAVSVPPLKLTSTIAKEAISEGEEDWNDQDTKKPTEILGNNPQTSANTSAIAKETISEGKEDWNDQDTKKPTEILGNNPQTSANTSTILKGTISEDEEDFHWNHLNAKKSLVIPGIDSRASSKLSKRRISVKKMTSESSFK